MNTTLKITAAILTAWAVVGYLEGPAHAWGLNTVKAKTAMPAPVIPGQPDATLQYRQELARVTAMLAKNPNAFGGFNTTNTLAELRAQVDRNIRTRHAREIAKAATQFEKAQLRAKHKTFWDGIIARRELRNKFSDEQNIVHSLMMIFTTRQKLNRKTVD
jgi:hypothetical protein